MAEKTDLSSAYRRLKSPNIKTRKRALKIIHDYKRYGKKAWLKQYKFRQKGSNPLSRLLPFFNYSYDYSSITDTLLLSTIKTN